METTTDRPRRVHEGRNVKRFREMLGIKQEALAHQLGEEWSQKRVSLLESKETIEPDLLSQVAKALNVPEEAIKTFSEEAAINIISSTLHNTNGLVNYNPIFTFNPIEKIVELYDEKIALMERLLQNEQEKVELLKGLRKD